MDVARLIFLLVGIAVSLFFVLFAAVSLRERKGRAAAISVAILLVVGLVWFGGYLFLSPSALALCLPAIVLLVAAILFFMPIGGQQLLRIAEVEEKVDERDVIFAREEYRPGTEKYEQYYGIRPEYKVADDKVRSLPELLKPGGRYYDPVRSPQIESTFDVVESLTTKVDGSISEPRLEVSPVEMTQNVKEIVLRLGASEVGIAELNPRYVYSHVGRGPERWGQPIENKHRFAVIFSLEMDYAHVEAAPHLSTTEESALQYLRQAQVSIFLSEYIRALGYPARAHIAGSNYQIMLPPVAYDAGLGELGRLGYLISPKFGARIRLGAVTTDLPLLADKPISFGVQDFCRRCVKCATNCPAGAIPEGDRTIVRGVEKWQLNIEKCFQYWRTIGTDCGLCMRVCPYSHPPSFVHNLVRAGIRRSSFARTVSIRGDDLFYGRRIKWD